MIPLDTAEAIELLVRRWRREMLDDLAGEAAGSARAADGFRRSSAQLRQRVWDPLVPHLSAVTRVFVVPDAALNLVPLAALRLDDSRFLVEAGPVIHYLSAERDLVPIPTGPPAAQRSDPAQAGRRELPENPLVLSGLALAGANRRHAAEPDEDDGILTAEEVTSLNLEGDEWAVLSACDTGLGQLRAGEGVVGLRRAFQVAGARTIIMSLWPVEDQAARGWMRALYHGRLQRRLDTADAVHQASLSLLQERRAAGQSTNPFYWAGFVAAGDWR